MEGCSNGRLWIAHAADWWIGSLVPTIHDTRRLDRVSHNLIHYAEVSSAPVVIAICVFIKIQGLSSHTNNHLGGR